MTTQLILLDDNDELRQVLADLLESYLGLRCLGLKSFEELMNHSKQAITSQVAILDIELGSKDSTGIDAFHWLRDQGFKGEVFFLTGHGRSHPLAIQALNSGAKIWEKPVSARQIVDCVSQCLSSEFRSELI